jgi:hypothetical protein
VYSLAASSVFNIPFWRHFLTWIGCVPATTGNFKKMLGKGSVAVVVGGIAEMYMQVTSVAGVFSCALYAGLQQPAEFIFHGVRIPFLAPLPDLDRLRSCNYRQLKKCWARAAWLSWLGASPRCTCR